jgi:nucleoside-diphosphate-sugar epimerase/phosphoglycolate phosphatase-like HAD superfamily hydrolase
MLPREYSVITLGRTAVSGVPHVYLDLARGKLDCGSIPNGAILVHAAAEVRRAASDGGHAARFHRVNVKGTARLIEALRPKRLAHIVLLSTTDVYAESDERIREDSTLDPATPYAKSKLEAERLVERAGVPVSILRLGNIYGPGEDAFQKLIPVAIRAALAGEAITIYGSGSARRDFVFVEDVARAVKIVIEKRLAGVFNIVSGRAVSVMDVVGLINTITGNSAGVNRVAGSETGERDRIFAPSLLRKFGWSAKTPLRSGLKREIEAVLESRPVVAIDLDGTLLDYWTRCYRLYAEYFGARAVSFAGYRRAKRSGCSEREIAQRHVADVDAYLAWKAAGIESWDLLASDRLAEGSLDLLRALHREFRVVLLTARRRPRLLRRQLERLSILPYFERVIATEDKAGALRQISASWYIADTEVDIAAAKAAGVRIAAAAWGLRSAGLLRKYGPDAIRPRLEFRRILGVCRSTITAAASAEKNSSSWCLKERMPRARPATASNSSSSYRDSP